MIIQGNEKEIISVVCCRVLFPGGGVDILKSPYAKIAKLMYELAIQVCMCM